MNLAAPKSAIQLLRWPLAATLLGIITAALFVAGSYYYLEYQKKSEMQSKRALQEAQARVTLANKEAEDLRDSVGLYQQLVAYGVFQKENRLSWIETINRLKIKHRLKQANRAVVHGKETLALADDVPQKIHQVAIVI